MTKQAAEDGNLANASKMFISSLSQESGAWAEASTAPFADGFDVEYHARLDLDMQGEWAVKLRLSGAVREEIILRLQP